VELGSVAVIALIAGLAGGVAGAALVGTVEGLLRQRQVMRGSATYGGRWSVSTGPAVAVPLDRLDTDSRKVLTLARQEAIQNGHSYVGSENLAMALRLYSTTTLGEIWSQLAIDPEALRRRIEATVPRILGPTPIEGAFTPRVARIVAISITFAAQRKRTEVSPELLLLALADEGGGTGAHALASLGATVQRVREVVDGASS
jgi:ClpA/ClpB-like protein